jgi:hypothetical protein
MSTNGSEPKALESMRWSNSEEVRHRFGGYRTISVVKLCGSAFTKESNSSPVPSIPGNSTSFGVAVGTEVMLAASPKTTRFESLLTEIHEATFAEALPRRTQDPNLSKRRHCRRDALRSRCLAVKVTCQIGNCQNNNRCGCPNGAADQYKVVAGA